MATRFSHFQYVEMSTFSWRAQMMRQRTKEFADQKQTVLIWGGQGCGKSTLANWMHEYRAILLKRKRLPQFTLESRLISRECIERRFSEMGENATFFFDNILTCLHPNVQDLIIQWIEKRNGPQLIFSTDENLEDALKLGAISPHLYRYLARTAVHMPDLSERLEDIPGIVRALLPEACNYTGIEYKFDDLPPHTLNNWIDLCAKKTIHNLRALRLHMEHFLELQSGNSRSINEYIVSL